MSSRRLSRAQLAALDEALTTRQALTPTKKRRVIKTVEEALCEYWTGVDFMRNEVPRSLAHLRKQLAQLVKASRVLRATKGGALLHMHSVTPFVMFFERSDAGRQQADELCKRLEDAERGWLWLLAEVTPKGRRPDLNLLVIAYKVIQALDHAGVQLDLGRDTAVVEVLKLVRRWATSSTFRRTSDYDFSRKVVRLYRAHAR